MIRAMELKDLEEIHKIECLSFSTPWTKDAFRTELSNDKAHYLVVEEDNKVVGYGGFWKILDEGHFTNLAITPEYRGKGLGTMLIDAMMKLASSLGVSEVTLEVRESNEAALKAYQSLGFYIEGKRSRYYTNPREDALIMWASLH